MVNNSHGKRMVREDLIKKLEELTSKQLVVKAKVANIKEISTEVLNGLECGDIVLKKTGNQYHSYIVTYKEANQGICLTYLDASCVETQSYDYVDGAWVYNSEDLFKFQTASATKLGAVKIGSGLSITSGGVLSTKNLMEDIVDSDGNNRFIEGTNQTLEITGVNFNQYIWSLSGTHLMIVLAGTIDANTSITTGVWATVTLPAWILAKIHPLLNQYVEVNKPCTQIDLEAEMNFHLRKYTDYLQISCGSIVTAPNKTSAFRIQFDLLIDNE